MTSFPDVFFVGARTRHCAYYKTNKQKQKKEKAETGQTIYGKITSAILNSTFILIHCWRFFIILRKATAWRF